MTHATSIEQLIGRTPLLELIHLQKQANTSARIMAKLERFNPAGSAKDRAALFMVNEAEAAGKLSAGGTIIEPTSGNTGIGLAMIAAVRGYQCIIVMPDTMSIERRQLMAAYGAQVVLSPGAEGMDGCVRVANEIQAKTPNSFIPDQFSNPANALAHYKTTGPEIWEDADGQVDAFIAGIGTGGTITGVGRFLKEKNPDCKIIAVEPASSPLLSEGHAAGHGIQGIGANFVPELLDRDIYDEIITISNEDAFEATRMLAAKEGLLAGISSGAAAAAALQVAARPEFAGKTIAVMFPDTGERYLSSGVFDA